MIKIKTPKAAICTVYVMSMFMVSMDTTMLNVALPVIAHEFGVSPSSVSSVNIAYLVSLAACLPAAGWIGDRFGSKRVLLTAIAVFTGASLFSGIASSHEMLNIGRILQGAGGSMIAPLGLSMLFRIVPAHERPQLSRSLILPIALAPALGPIVSGLFVEFLTWRWGFYMNIPIGLTAILIGWLFLKEQKKKKVERFDRKGFLLAAPGLGMAIYAVNQSAEQGWSSPIIVIMGITGVLFLALLVRVQLRADQPLLNLRLYEDRLFRSMATIMLFAQAGLIGLLFVFPLMYQNVMNATALESSLVIFPEALGLMIASQLTPRTYKWLGPRRVISIGLGCTAVIFVVLSLTQPETNAWYLRSLFFLIGIFLGHTVGAIQFSVFANISGPQMSKATTLFQVQNRIGAAIGIAILASVLAMFGSGPVGGSDDGLFAYRVAMLTTAGFLLVALALSSRIHDADAQTAMKRSAEQAKAG